MRIAHLVSNFRPLIGGDGQIAYYFAKELVFRGHEVTVLTCLPPSLLKRIPTEETINGFAIVRFPSVRTGLKLKLYDPYMKGLLTHLVRHEYDIVHCHSFHYFHALLCALLKRKKLFKLIIQTHHPWQYANLPVFFEGIYRAIRDNHTKFILNASDLIVAITPHDVERIARLGIDIGKVRILPNGIYWNKYQKGNQSNFKDKYEVSKDEKIILFLGRLDENKGLLFLINSIAHLTSMSKTPNFKLVIAGKDYGMRKKTEDLAGKQHVDDLIIFTGALSERDKINALRACDVFVLPSSYEGFGVVLLEAQAAGKPVIATKVGGMPYSVRDGETGFLVPFGIKEEMSGKLQLLLEDEQLRKTMGEKGKRFAKAFDYGILIPKLTEIYESLLHK